MTGDVHTNLGFVRTMRIAWRVGLYVTSLAIAVWLAINLYTRRYFADIGHFLSTTLLLLLIAGLVYNLAFRSQDIAFVKLNLSLMAVGVGLLACEVGIRAWERYDPISR